MKNSTALTRSGNIVSGNVICPYCGENVAFTEGTNGTATIVSVGRNQSTRLHTGEKYTEERIGLELNVKCVSCAYTSRSAGEIISEI